MATLLPGAVWRPISRNFTNSNRRTTRGAVLHVDAGGANSLFGWFNNPSAQASSHLYVKYDGTIEQYVDLDKIAWTQRSGNATMIGIETQGVGSGSWTNAQIKSIAYALEWLARHYGFPLVDMQTSYPSARGIGLHRYGCNPWRVAGGQVWGPRGKVCPGDNRVAQFKSGAVTGGGGSVPPGGGGGGGGQSPADKYNAGFSVDHIKWVQTELKKRGLYSDTIDGIRGPNTQAAIKAFQQANGLVVDGYPGPATTAKLKGQPAPAPQPPASTGLRVDGFGGPATIKRWQQIMGTTQDGVISGQGTADRKYHVNLETVNYGPGGSNLVRAVQRVVGATADGYLGPNTIKRIQARLGVAQDGYFGPGTVKALQARLNTGKF